MKIYVKTKPNAKEEKVEKISDTDFVVGVREAPIKGRANRAVVKALANYFSISSSQIQILAGHTSKQKIIEIFGSNSRE